MPHVPEVRVARIIARLNVGGPAIHVCSLTSRLPPPFVTRLYVGDVGPGEEEMTAASERERVDPIRIAGLGRAIRPVDATALWTLIRALRSFRPHIVHTHTAKAGALGRLAARAVGVPILVHTFHGHVFDGYFNPLVTRAFVSIERALARLTDAVITLSPRQQSDIVSKYRIATADRVHVIPLGFDFERFDDLTGSVGALRRELGLPAAAPVVASIGRLTAIKDHALLFQAFRHVRDEAHLVVVGGGEELPHLLELARSLEIHHRVHFLGFRSDIDRILADAKVVALTSLNEGTPVAVIEALAAGCLPVATAVGGVEDVLEGGRWGTLVRTRSPVDFAGAIEAALDQAPAMTDGEIAARKAYARRRYGVGRLVEEHEALYRQLLAQHGSLEPMRPPTQQTSRHEPQPIRSIR
jgi:glycosyltransferase involved in cell wall biosynthesis